MPTAAFTTFEHHFITHDKETVGGVETDVIFDLIEDENGNFWGYGHVDSDKFHAEIKRWRAHVAPTESLPEPGAVEYLWCAFRGDDPNADEGYGEFVLVSEAERAENRYRNEFPVTRVVV